MAVNPWSMRAIILAAGRGTRLRPLTDRQHKTELVVGGQSLIERILASLVDFEEVVVVTGYRANQVESLLRGHPRVRVVENGRFQETGNLTSLVLALRAIPLDHPVALIESDLIFSETVFQRLHRSPHPNVALVAPYRVGMDGTVVALEGERIRRFLPSHKQLPEIVLSSHFKTLNLYRLSAELCQVLAADDSDHDLASCYEVLLDKIVERGSAVIHAEVVHEECWAEIDDPNDLTLARARFEPGGLARAVQCDHGGLWNYPVLDFCYLRNPYFPSPALWSALQAHLQTILGHYGSSQTTLNRKLSYLLHCDQDRVIVLNGASQAFPWLSEFWKGKKVLQPWPTFGEYPRWFKGPCYADRVGYNLDDIEADLDQASVAVVVNPNNPTGSQVDTRELYALCQRRPDRFFLVDESFLDFSGQTGMVELLELSPLANVAVLKSLGKSLGAPGLRLGFLYTDCPRLRKFVVDRLPIWNSSSLAEHFLELLLKHRESMQASFEQVARERSELALSLAKVPGVEEVYPGGGNFLLLRQRGPSLQGRLLERGLLVKDVSEKLADGRSYLRIGMRSKEDNQILLRHLAELLAQTEAVSSSQL